MTKEKIYKAAVIGCGYIGAGSEYFHSSVQPATHAGAYKDNNRTKLVAFVDVDNIALKKAQNIFPGTNIYNDVESMIDAEKPDIVSVASPTSEHYKHVMTLAKYSIPAILCEKPLADSVSMGKEMIDICKKNGSLLFTNYQRRFDPLIQKWVKKIKEGVLGNIYQGNVYYYNGLRNNAGHMLDLLNLFLGKPKSVQVSFNKTTETSGKGFNVDGVIYYPNDIMVTLQSLTENYGYFALTFFGENGSLSITKNTSPVIELRKKIKNKEAKKYFELSPVAVREGNARSMLSPVIRHVVDCLDRSVSPMGTGEDGLNVLTILDDLEQSAKADGKKVLIK